MISILCDWNHTKGGRGEKERRSCFECDVARSHAAERNPVIERLLWRGRGCSSETPHASLSTKRIPRSRFTPSE